jgi:phenylpropionate dioxygenase-like ring-hydroxylating dioxygenase large terminal subunit
MDTATVQRFLDGMKYESERTAPPEGFPSLPDIPAGRYTDPAFLELEMTHLWRKSWLYACHIDELPEPGSYLLWRKTGSPILIVRGKDDVVRAFYNTCRHRGGPLVKSACGKADGLVCGYHGWTYNLEGKLINLRDRRDFPGLDLSQRPLIGVRCERFYNWIFINENLGAEPLLEHVHPFFEYFRQFEPECWRLVAKEAFDVNCNVKVLLDAFLEVYHLKSIHQNTVDRFLDHRGTTIALYREGHSIMVTPNRRPDWQDPGTRGMRKIESATVVSSQNNPSIPPAPRSSRSGRPRRPACGSNAIGSRRTGAAARRPTCGRSGSRISTGSSTRICNSDRRYRNRSCRRASAAFR